MGAIYDALIRFLEEDDWSYSQVEEHPIARFTFGGDNGNWSCYAQAREEQEQLIIYSLCPFNAPETRRHEVAEFLTRANYGLVIGNFEPDYADGAIRYKTSLDIAPAHLNTDLIKRLLYPNLLTMDKYLPGIIGVAHAGKSPEQAVAEIEG